VLVISSAYSPRNPSIQLSPSGSRTIYYTGEHLNITCTSSEVGTVLTWNATNLGGAQEALSLPAPIINEQSSQLVFRPITFNDISFSLRCTASIPGNANLIAGEAPIIVNIFGKKHF